MATFYPMKFKPVYQAKIWGGRCLTRFFNRPTPQVSPVGESWELFSNEFGSSVVSEGLMQGVTLRELCEKHPQELYGVQADEYSKNPKKDFPLIIKYINAEEPLSIQVHPDDRYAAKFENGNGKTEAWYIVDAKPGATVCRSFKPGVTAEKARTAIRAGKAGDVIHSYSVEKGQSIMIPPGTIHGIGKGILIAEVQENSDLTYRAYDYDRTDAKGQKRQLHVDKVLDVLKFQDQNDFIKEVKLSSLCSKLTLNDVFSLYKYRFREPIHDYSYNRFRILCNVEGHGTIISPDSLFDDIEFHPGDTILMPACLQDFSLVPATLCTMLEIFGGRFEKSDEHVQGQDRRPMNQ